MDVRWRFPAADEPPAERAARQRTLEAINGWWAAFARRAPDLVAHFEGRQRWDLAGWMIEELARIHPELMWEFGPGTRDGHCLVITPESATHLRPLVEVVLTRAPALAGWEFRAHRRPEGLAMAVPTVQARCGGTLDGYRVRVAREEHHRVALTFLSPRVEGADDEQASSEAFVAAEALLGEERLERWIGAIEVARLPAVQRSRFRWFGRGADAPAGAEEGSVPLERLAETVEAVVGEIRAELPPGPCLDWAPGAGWTVLEVKLPERPDGADYDTRSDLLFATTCHPVFWQAAHADVPFYGERFSLTGEVFCYLKIDGAEGLGDGDGAFEDRAGIEDALTELLHPARLGAVLGGGTGRRYSYVDLALSDIDRALPLIVERLRAGRLPLRSWILFFERPWSEEWVGVYPDTPPPPRRRSSMTGV